MKKLLWIAALAASAVAVRAAELRACPPWQVAVVDEQGKPLDGCAVVQEWNCKFPAGFVARTTNAVTDAEGRVALPERWLSPPPPAKGVNGFLDKLSAPPPPDPTANIFVWKRGFAPVRVFSRRDVNVLLTRDGFQSKVVLRPEKSVR